MLKSLTVLAAAGVLSSAASAATITVETFSMAAYNAQTSGQAMTEDFEDFSSLSGSFESNAAFIDPHEGTLNGALGSSVGTFSAIGGTGTGTTCQNNDVNNSCGDLALERSTINGQGNIAPFDGDYGLSSNDTLGISWQIELDGGMPFTRAVFALRDAADVNDKVLTITAGGTTRTLHSLPNDNIQLVMIDFGRRMTSAAVEIRTGVNDGFTFDAASVAPVPLPAAALLMFSGLGALGAVAGRRKRKKAS